MSSPENIPKFTIREYGSDVIPALKDIKLKCKDTTYLGVHILEEATPIGTQHLETDDIIEELEKVPTNIRRFISSIVLFPFGHPKPDFFSKRAGRKIILLASANANLRQITIYAFPEKSQNVMKDYLANQFTLLHEAGHIIDGVVLRQEEFVAYSSRWTQAMCKDCQVRHNKSKYSAYFVSSYSEEMQSLREDFADSVMYFSDGIHNEDLKTYCPNRYKILEELINGR
jgi:hypothetical protein